MMEMSEPAEWVNEPFLGFTVNAEFSGENSVRLLEIINGIQSTFPDSVFCAPKHALHITLLDWVTPLFDYDGQDKLALYEQIKPGYDNVLSGILAGVKPIKIQFDELHVSPSTIYLTGHDNGEFKAIRDQFVEGVHLMPGAKMPPQIIHSSLARFTSPIGLAAVHSFLDSKTVSFTQTVSDFRLVRTELEPMLEFEVLKRYKLNKQ